MDFYSRLLIFLLSTGVFFIVAILIPLTEGLLLLLPPLLALACTVLMDHIFSQKKRLQALENTLSEINDTLKEMKKAIPSEKDA